MLTWKSTYVPTPVRVVLAFSDQNNVSAKSEALLQQKGCVIIQEKPQYAFETCHVIDPALIVIDTHLSHIERLVLCSKLRTISSKPIILLVDESISSHMIDFYNAGVDECLLKPVSPAFLVIKAMSWLLRSQWLDYSYELPPIQTIS